MKDAKLVAYNFSKDGATYTFEGVSLHEINSAIDSRLATEGYKLESGVSGNGVYGVGSTIMRVLFGAFVKRYTFNINTNAASEARVNLTVSKAMSGISGGVIGYAKMNKEHQRISELLRQMAPSVNNEELIYKSLIAEER
jgi:hypothetical protein